MQILTIDHLKIVFNELQSCSKKWYYIGLELDFSADTLDNIESESSDPNGYLLKVLKRYLRRSDPHPTWKRIVAALKSKSVGYEQLADQIERQYCRDCETTNDSSTCKSNSNYSSLEYLPCTHCAHEVACSSLTMYTACCAL